MALFEHDGVRCGVRFDMAGVSTDAPRHSWRVDATDVAVGVDRRDGAAVVCAGRSGPAAAHDVRRARLRHGDCRAWDDCMLSIIPPSDAAVLRIILIYKI